MNNIIFDLGNVLLMFHPEEYLSKFFDKKTMEDLMIIIFCSDEWIELDLGNLMIDDVIMLFSHQYPKYKEEISFVLNNWTEMLSPIEENVEILRKLHDLGYSLYYLSNFHKEAFESMVKKYDFFQLFKGGIVSAYEHVIKPDERIYKKLLHQFYLNPKDCLFIDDSIMNIRAASEFGINGIELSYGVNLKEELLKKGIEI